MKFLAWFLGIILIGFSVFVISFYNFHQIIFSPEKTKSTLVNIDFYNQAKSTIKKDLFEAQSQDVAQADQFSPVINRVLDSYDFRPQIENLIDGFYLALENKSANQVLTVDLRQIKSQFGSQLSALNNVENSELASQPIPDQWQIDLSSYSGSFGTLSFVYRNFDTIVIVWFVLIFLFLLFCILSSIKYLKLFFSIALIIGLLMLSQKVFWYFVNPSAFLSAITDQGRSGLLIIVENLADYVRNESSRILLWQSLGLIIPSIVGIIIFSFVGNPKPKNIPLADTVKK